MDSDERVVEAAGRLYAIDAQDFTALRTELAAAARQAGDRVAAKLIVALRKPSRSASVVNRLVAAEPETAHRLSELGDALRTAQRTLATAELRDLGKQRRFVVDTLAARAFQIASVTAPAPALREEVVGTLNAALADPVLCNQVAQGRLLQSLQWEGFGSGGRPDLSLVPNTVLTVEPSSPEAAPPSAEPEPAPARPPERPGTSLRERRDAALRARQEAADRTRQQAAEKLAQGRANAERERRRRDLEQARRVAAETDEAARRATKAVRERDGHVRQLEADLRRLGDELAGARRQAAEAASELGLITEKQRQAQERMGRLQD